MASVKLLALAGSAVILSLNTAGAADLRLPPPPPVVAVPVVEFSGWYLRGDIGMTNQGLDKIHNPKMTAPAITQFEFLEEGKFDNGMLFGLGFGYQFNPWLRIDVTGEYRGKTAFFALDRYEWGDPGHPNGWDVVNDYRMRKSEWLALANLYVDLGTWWCVTPFIGAGAGMVRIDIDGYRDVNQDAHIQYSASTEKWNFAWALHAGLAYKVTPNFVVELAYRYLNMGDAATADTQSWSVNDPLYDKTDFRGLYSHDVKLGVRWLLNPEPPPPPVLVRKG